MKNILIILVLVSLLASCSSPDEPTYTVENIDGVRHIHNHEALWGSDAGVELEFIQKTGVLESTDENYMLYKPNDVVVDSKGNIYISEAGNYRVQKYSPNGEYIQTIR